jgi:hypothetical protein
MFAGSHNITRALCLSGSVYVLLGCGRLTSPMGWPRDWTLLESDGYMECASNLRPELFEELRRGGATKCKLSTSLVRRIVLQCLKTTKAHGSVWAMQSNCDGTVEG